MAKLCEFSALPQARAQHGHGPSSISRPWRGSSPPGGLSQGRSLRGAPPEPELGRALRHSPGRFRSPALSEPAQPTRPLWCSALPAAPAQRQLCCPAAGQRSPGLVRTCWPCRAPSNRPCLPAPSRHSWPSFQAGQTMIWQQDGYIE